jgi:tartrate dehydratase alpha subunit/fumarate hydratase class I-like protein
MEMMMMKQHHKEDVKLKHIIVQLLQNIDLAQEEEWRMIQDSELQEIEVVIGSTDS